MQSPLVELKQAMQNERASRVLVGHKLEVADGANLTEPKLYKIQNIKFNESRWLFEAPTISTKTHTTPLIFNRIDFAEAFAKKTKRALINGFDNILVAGGSIFGVIYGSQINDFDIFVYGLERDEATRRIYELVQCLTMFDYDAKIINGERCTTVVVDGMKFQIIHRLYKNIAEILYGFDISSCAAGFDGRDVYFTELAKFSFEYMCNVIDLTRRSTTYEPRLIKYLLRGFNIIMLDFDMCVLRTDNLKYNHDEICELPHLAFSYKKVAYNEIAFSRLISKYNEVCDYLDYKPRKIIRLVGYSASVDKKNLSDPLKCAYIINSSSRHIVVNIIKINWLVIDPGTQVNGSMKPSILSEKDWYGAYHKE